MHQQAGERFMQASLYYDKLYRAPPHTNNPHNLFLFLYRFHH